MKKIPLTQGKFAVVDDADFKKASSVNWCFLRGYAVGANGLKLHRFLLGLTNPKIMVDHKDRDGLNCRRSNLRIATRSQNAMNMAKRRGLTSRFKGVSWDSARSKWFAKIRLNYKQIALGRFDDEESAARVYDAKAAEVFGEFAKLNF